MLVDELPHVSISIDNHEPMLEEFDTRTLEEIIGSVVDRRVGLALFDERITKRMSRRRERDRAHLV